MTNASEYRMGHFERKLIAEAFGIAPREVPALMDRIAAEAEALRLKAEADQAWVEAQAERPFLETDGIAFY